MKVIGVTGGIGSGKSTVTGVLEKQYHACLINTDQIAHKLMEKGMISYNLIVEYFGKEILNETQEINRVRLGKIVYGAPEKLKVLNSLTHPYVMEYVSELIHKLRMEERDLVCVETALPVEAGLKDICDEIWYVHTSPAIRRKRLMEQRNYSEEKIESIFGRQLSEEEYQRLSTHRLINDGSLESIREQIEVLLENQAFL